MKINIKDFSRKVKPIRESDVYGVYDLKKLKHLVVSMTILHRNKSTKGHSHQKAEEVYYFLKGSGKMQINTSKIQVKGNDIVLIEQGDFHRVFNTGNGDLVFISIFEKYAGRGN